MAEILVLCGDDLDNAISDFAETVAQTVLNNPGFDLRVTQDGLESIKLFGVPRGGAVVASILDSRSRLWVTAGLDRSRIRLEQVFDPEHADVIVDDIVDSGKTRESWKDRYPNLPFHSLVEKQAGCTLWYVFPWEYSDGTPEASSGRDICTRLLEYIGEDVNRGGLRATPERFERAWKFWTSGYTRDPMAYLRTFDDGAEQHDQMILLRNIPVYSHCEHHLAPFFGVANIAYIPNGRILGLSKISRIVDVFARRLQVQERLTDQIAHTLEEGLQPTGVAVQLVCRHTCMESRGICQAGIETSTCSLLGVFRHNDAARQEFLNGVTTG